MGVYWVALELHTCLIFPFSTQKGGWVVHIAIESLLGTKACFLCFPACSVMRTLTELSSSGRMVAQLVEALCYKQKGCGFDSCWCHWHPSGCTMALGSTQPLTEMSTRNISWGVNAAGALGWQPYHLHVLIVLKSGKLNLLEPSAPVQACNGIALCF